ncbi:MAG: malate dehydrogenase (oxaloacetate-decarboxylating) [Saprospiraceae bacterium]|jgi:malate dehydrogenase (oxaloacetate-decarboxylating)
MDYYKDSLFLHEKLRGKIGTKIKMTVRTKDDLSLVYSPGVAEPCRKIAENKADVYKYTMKGNTVAIITDGTAVLGLGDIGPEAALPVMEGKAMLFKKFADIDAFPICLDTTDVDEIVRTVRNIAPVFGGINLEDISAPRSFEIEERLQDLGIPVFHDDQHGTAIVVLAALINACKVTDRKLEELSVVINGSGAAGVAIAKLLRCIGSEGEYCTPVGSIIICDSKGVISRQRTDLNPSKKELLSFSNFEDIHGTLQDALKGADVFIGVSVGNLLNADDVRTMAKDSIVFGLANPTPEIMPEEAYKGGAAIIGTGRSDMPNQVNNVLGFPGIFRGALDARAKIISPRMKLAAAHAIADCVKHPTKESIIPSALNERVAYAVADAVREVAEDEIAKGLQ